MIYHICGYFKVGLGAIHPAQQTATNKTLMGGNYLPPVTITYER